MAYELLDQGFFLFHAALVLFVLIGWCWRRARPWHLGLIVLTAFSWFILGIRYGFGYCPCTGWHWHIRNRLGHYDMPRSYLKFLFDRFTGLDANEAWVDRVAFAAFFLVGFLSLALVTRDWWRGRRPPREDTES